MRIWHPVFAQIDLKRCTLKIKDGGANFIEVKIGTGNLQYTESRNIEYVPNRGLLDSNAEVREGDQVPVDVSFEFVWDYIKGTTGTGGVASVEDALKQLGAAAAWVSSDADACRPYAVDLEFKFDPTPSTCGQVETITLPDFRWEKLTHDARGGTISCTGKCNAVSATAVRSTNTA